MQLNDGRGGLASKRNRARAGETTMNDSQMNTTVPNDVRFEVDSTHNRFDIFEEPISKDIWLQKYRFKDEPTVIDTIGRIVEGVYMDDTPLHRQEAFEAMT